MKDRLIKELQAFTPFNKQEAKDRERILWMLMHEDYLFTRENETAHMTASAWIVNEDHTKALMAYHNIYNSWSWLGGHADGNENLLEVAIKEAKEESGLSQVHPISDHIYSLEILTVDGHEKHGHYVSSHLHLNITYLLEATEKEPLRCKEDENTDVQWFSLEDAIASSTEEWFKKRIYSKLNQKLYRSLVTS